MASNHLGNIIQNQRNVPPSPNANFSRSLSSSNSNEVNSSSNAGTNTTTNTSSTNETKDSLQKRIDDLKKEYESRSSRTAGSNNDNQVQAQCGASQSQGSRQYGHENLSKDITDGKKILQDIKNSQGLSNQDKVQLAKDLQGAFNVMDTGIRSQNDSLTSRINSRRTQLSQDQRALNGAKGQEREDLQSSIDSSEAAISGLQNQTITLTSDRSQLTGALSAINSFIVSTSVFGG